MARPLRLEFPGGLYHVTSRGDRREPIVEDDEDRAGWVQVLGDCCSRFGWCLHAWCLMTNHYHLLLETPRANLSAGMRQLNGVWSQAFNRRHGRVGHVFQGRFKAIVVERETHLMELARYVVLNPVRAGMVADAAAHRWSSHRAMLGLSDAAPQPAGLQCNPLLRRFGPDRRTAVGRYADFVRAGVGLPPVWQALQGEVFLGSPGFQQRMLDKLGLSAAVQVDARWREVPRVQRQPQVVPLAEWATRHPAAEAMARAFDSGQYRLAEIAEHFGVHPSTVSRAARRWRERAQPVAAASPQQAQAGDGQ